MQKEEEEEKKWLCEGDGLCLEFDEYSDTWVRSAKWTCKKKCTTKNCNGKGCTQKAPEWMIKRNAGLCIHCIFKDI